MACDIFRYQELHAGGDVRGMQVVCGLVEFDVTGRSFMPDTTWWWLWLSKPWARTPIPVSTQAADRRISHLKDSAELYLSMLVSM